MKTGIVCGQKGDVFMTLLEAETGKTYTIKEIKTDDDDAAERAGRYIMRKFKIKNV